MLCDPPLAAKQGKFLANQFTDYLAPGFEERMGMDVPGIVGIKTRQ